jgi:TIR domain-containing protein
MSGQIFISYRREDSSAWAGRLSDRLSSHFPSNQIFMDVDTIEPGIDFVEAIEESVGSCDVLIAVIGTHWLNSSNPAGKRRLEIPEDSVRVEVSTALKRGIRVIPVLVEGATMPEAADLPDELKALVRRNALKLSHDRFRTESELLASTVGRVLENAEARRRELEERERLETERRETEEKERREAERRQKEEQGRLEAERSQREETDRINEGGEREQREREETGVRERQEEKQPEPRHGENEERALPVAGIHGPTPDKGVRRFSQLLRKYKTVIGLGLTAAIIVTGIVFMSHFSRQNASSLKSKSSRAFMAVTPPAKVGDDIWQLNSGQFEKLGSIAVLNDWRSPPTISILKPNATYEVITTSEFFKSGDYFVQIP